MVLGSLSINPGYLVVGAGSFHSTLRFSLAAKGLNPEDGGGRFLQKVGNTKKGCNLNVSGF
jgi:hypothetical protein